MMKETPEIRLRQIWSQAGIPEHEQDRMLENIERDALEMYQRRAVQLGKKRKAEK